MSTLFRLSVPNLAGVLAIALAPLFVANLRPHSVSTPSSVASGQVSHETPLAETSLNIAVEVEASASEQLAAMQ